MPTKLAWFLCYLLACGCFDCSRLDASEPPVTSVIFSFDGEAVVACSQVGLRVFSWPDLQLKRTLQVGIVNLHEAAFSPAGDRLAVGGGTPAEDGTVQILSWPEGEAVLALQGGHSDSVMSLVWLSEFSLASASLDHEIVLWDADAGTQSRILKGHSRGVSSLCFLATEKILVSAGVDQNLRVWNLDSGELIRSLPMHIMPVNSIALRPASDGLQVVASASDDRTVRLWQPTIGRMVRFARLKSKPLDVAWLADGSQVVACCTDGQVYLIDPDTVEVNRSMPAVDGWAYSIAVHPKDGSLVVGGSNGQVRRVSHSSLHP